jgi:hypothetical protein
MPRDRMRKTQENQACRRVRPAPTVQVGRWMLEVQLIRDRNRVCDALTDCRTLVEDTLRQLR